MVFILNLNSRTMAFTLNLISLKSYLHKQFLYALLVHFKSDLYYFTVGNIFEKSRLRQTTILIKCADTSS